MLHRPPNLGCQHDQAGPTSFAREFGVGPLFASAGLIQNSAISVGCPEPCRPVGFQRRHEGGVNGELGSAPKRESVCHNFQPPSIQCVEMPQIHVTDEHVRGDSCPSFATDLRSRAFQREPSPPQDPCHLARCAAGTQGQGKGKAKTTAEQEAERLRLYPHHTGCRKHRERSGCKWPMLGPHQSSSWIIQRWPHLVVNECSACFTACRCQPTFGWLGSGSTSTTGGDSDSSNHGGICRPASASDLLHSWTDLKQGAVPCWRWVIINSATSGCRCLTILKQSAQLAQCAALRVRLALVRPNPPADNAKLATT